MKHVLLIGLLAGFAVLQLGATENLPAKPTNAPARIALRDQFDVPRVIAFPTSNLTFLTIADKAGSQQIPEWVTAIKQRFGDRVMIEGIADVSSVPRPLRGMVRRGFQHDLAHPVLLDWSGDVVKTLAFVPSQANLFALDRDGKILKRVAGAATAERVAEICAALESDRVGESKPVAKQ